MLELPFTENNENALIQKKQDLFYKFQRYLGKVKPDIMSSHFQECHGSQKKFVYLKKFVIRQNSTAIFFSNQLAQMRFIDGTELIVDKYDKQIFFATETGKITQIDLEEVSECEDKELVKRFKYMRKLYPELYDLSNNHELQQKFGKIAAELRGETNAN